MNEQLQAIYNQYKTVAPDVTEEMFINGYKLSGDNYLSAIDEVLKKKEPTEPTTAENIQTQTESIVPTTVMEQLQGVSQNQVDDRLQQSATSSVSDITPQPISTELPSTETASIGVNDLQPNQPITTNIATPTEQPLGDIGVAQMPTFKKPNLGAVVYPTNQEEAQERQKVIDRINIGINEQNRQIRLENQKLTPTVTETQTTNDNIKTTNDTYDGRKIVTDEKGVKYVDYGNNNFVNLSLMPTIKTEEQLKKEREDFLKDNNLDHAKTKFEKVTLDTQFGDDKIYADGTPIKDVKAYNDEVKNEIDKGNYVPIYNPKTKKYETTPQGRIRFTYARQEQVDEENAKREALANAGEEHNKDNARQRLGDALNPTPKYQSPLTQWGNELYKETGYLLDEKDYSNLTTDEDRARFFATKKADKELKENPNANYNDIFQKEFKEQSKEQFTPAQYENAGDTVADMFLESMNIEADKHYNKVGAKEVSDRYSGYNAEAHNKERNFLNKLKQNPAFKRQVGEWLLKEGQYGVADYKERFYINANTQNKRTALIDQIQAYTDNEDNTNIEVQSRIIEQRKNNIRQQANKGNFTEVEKLRNDINSSAEVINKNDENKKQRNEAFEGWKSNMTVTNQEQDRIDKLTAQANSGDGWARAKVTLINTVDKTVKGLVKDPILGVLGVVNMVAGSDRLQDVLDDAKKVQAYGSHTTDNMFNVTTDYKLNGVNVKEKDGRFFSVDKNGTWSPLKLSYSDKENLQFVKTNKSFSITGAFSDTVGQIASMTGANYIGKTAYLMTGLKGLNTVKNAINIFGKESALTKGLIGIRNFAGKTSNQGAGGWFLQTYADNFQEGKQNGMNNSQANMYALMQSAITGVLSKINPDAKFFNTSYKNLQQQLISNLTKGNRNGIIESLISFGEDVIKHGGKEVVGENIQEFVEAIAGQGYKIIQQPFTDAKFDAMTWDDVMETAIATTLSTGGIAIGNRMMQGRNPNVIQFDGGNFDLNRLTKAEKMVMLSRLDTSSSFDDLKTNFLTNNKSVDRVERELTEIKRLSDKIPNATQYSLEANAFAVQGLYKIEQLRNSEKSADPMFKEQIQAEVTAIETKIKEVLDNDIKEQQGETETVNPNPTTETPNTETVQEQTDISDTEPEQTAVQQTEPIAPIKPNGSAGATAESGVVNDNQTQSRITEIKNQLGHQGNKNLFEHLLNQINIGLDYLTNEELNILAENIGNNDIAIVGGTSDSNRNHIERGDMDTAWSELPNNLQGVDLQEYQTALAKLFLHIQNEERTRLQPQMSKVIGGRKNSEPIFIGEIIKQKLLDKINQNNGQITPEIQSPTAETPNTETETVNPNPTTETPNTETEIIKPNLSDIHSQISAMDNEYQSLDLNTDEGKSRKAELENERNALMENVSVDDIKAEAKAHAETYPQLSADYEKAQKDLEQNPKDKTLKQKEKEAGQRLNDFANESNKFNQLLKAKGDKGLFVAGNYVPFKGSENTTTVEQTTKALSELDKDVLANSDIPLPQLEIDGHKNIPSKSYDKNNPEQVAKAYHTAKEDGTNPELVTAVEKLLKPKETPIEAKKKEIEKKHNITISQDKDGRYNFIPNELTSEKQNNESRDAIKELQNLYNETKENTTAESGKQSKDKTDETTNTSVQAEKDKTDFTDEEDLDFLNNFKEEEKTPETKPKTISHKGNEYTRHDDGTYTKPDKNGKNRKVTSPKTIQELNDLHEAENVVETKEKDGYTYKKYKDGRETIASPKGNVIEAKTQRTTRKKGKIETKTINNPSFAKYKAIIDETITDGKAKQEDDFPFSATNEANINTTPQQKAEAKSIVKFLSNKFKGLFADGQKAFDEKLKSLGINEGSLKFLSLWHGSSHNFNEFSLTKIGTGEGAQAFGWGLYFTDLKGIAVGYAHNLAYNKLINIWRDGDEMPDKAYSALKEVDFLGFDDEWGALRVFRSRSKEKVMNDYDLTESEYDTIIKSLFDNGRNLYSVKIHGDKTVEELNFLEWDKKPTREQTNKIIEQIKTDNPDALPRTWFDWSGNGRDIYESLSKYLGSPQKASELLLKAGVDGIRYPAESISRGITSDNARGFNYVVFDDNVISVEEKIQFLKDKNGTVFGLYDPKENKIYLNEKNLNPKTVWHEATHFQQAILKAMAGKGNTEAKAILSQFEKLLKPFIAQLEKGKTTVTINGQDIPLKADVYRKGKNESTEAYRDRMQDEVWAFLQQEENNKLWQKNDTPFKRAVNKFKEAITNLYKSVFNIPKGKDISNMTLAELVGHTAKQLQEGRLENIGKKESGGKELKGAKDILTEKEPTISNLTDTQLERLLRNQNLITDGKCA
ncbi:MAG: hypothetical protein E6R13_00945 [Spirochaetes bacterium]|nr:MAG: hypothetical protein E6R13_00945 [Spirochaetota bacterium]